MPVWEMQGKSGNLSNFLFFKKYFIYLFLEREREGEREGNKHQCVVASLAPPTGDLAHNTGMCPDWELNQQPLDSQSNAQSTEPHQPGLCLPIIFTVKFKLL